MSARRNAMRLFARGASARGLRALEAWRGENPRDLYARELLIWRPGESSALQRTKTIRDFFSQNVADGATRTQWPPPSRTTGWNLQLVAGFDHAERFLKSGRIDQAIEQYEFLLGHGMDGAPLRHGLALGLLELGHRTEASQEFEAALQLDPGYLPVIEDYTTWLMQDGRFDKVERFSSEFLAAEPEQRKDLYLNGPRLVAEAQKRAESIEALKSAVELYHRGAKAKSLAILLIRCRHYLSLLPLLEMVVPLCFEVGVQEPAKHRLVELLEGQPIPRLYLEGLFLQREKKAEEALEKFTAAVEKESRDPTLLCSRGLAFEKLGRTEEEDADLASAYKRAPWLIQARIEIAWNRLREEDWEAVLNASDPPDDQRRLALNYGIKGPSKVARLEYLTLTALSRLERTQEAVSRAQAAHQGLPSRWLHLRRALVLCEGKCYDAALTALEAGCELEDGPASTDTQSDAQLLRDLASRFPGSSPAALTSALIPAYAGDLAAARQKLEQVVQRFPEDVKSRVHLARVLWALTEPTAAAEHCTSFLERHPGQKEVQAILGGILWEREDLESLLDLRLKGEARRVQLEQALSLATEKNLEEEARRIAQELAEGFPEHLQALGYLIAKTDSSSPEWLKWCSALAEGLPWDPYPVALLAHQHLRLGHFERSMEVYEENMVGGHSFQSLGDYALATMGWEQEQGDQG